MCAAIERKHMKSRRRYRLSCDDGRGHSGHRAENAGWSGALSSSTMMVTITAKTASEYAASRCAVTSSPIVRAPSTNELLRVSSLSRPVSPVKFVHGPCHLPQGRYRRHQGLLSRGWAEGRADDPVAAWLSDRRPHVRSEERRVGKECRSRWGR